MRWLVETLEQCAAASLDDEHDRETVAKIIAEQLARRCKICYVDLAGKRDRTHFVEATDTKPCRGSWP